MSGVFFTSDPHVGHRFIAVDVRGFETVAAHDQAIYDRWCSVVKPDDQVWVLGDMNVGPDAPMLEFVNELPGWKHLVAGNHDAVHPMHRESWKHQARWMGSFVSIQAFARRRFNGKDVLLSHFPYDDDHTSDVRYTQYRLKDEGKWLLHGHTHKADQRFHHGNQIHVGMDAWDLTPVSIGTIIEIMEGTER